MSNIPFLVSIIVLLAGGQVLFKRAGLAIQGQSLPEGVRALATLPSFYLALILYGLSTVLWVFVLSRMPLSQAYPWLASSAIAVPLLGWLVFGEHVTPTFWVGMALMIGGLLLTQLGGQR